MPIPNGNPQIENGHIDIANELAEALAMINISSYESRVLWIILRKTYGWHKKSDWISLSQFVELTGLKKPHIIRAIKKLVSKNIITQIGNDKGKEYSINKHYKNWKSLPKQVIFKDGSRTITLDDIKARIRERDNNTCQICGYSDKMLPVHHIDYNQGNNDESNLITLCPSCHGKTSSNYDFWRDKLPKEVTTVTQIGNASLPKEVPTKETITKETVTKESNTYISEHEIFDFWNSLKKEYPRLQSSRNFEGVKDSISAKLKIYSVDDIKRSMENYVKILQNEKGYFWWSYSWSLKNFLLRGLEKFVPENFDVISYVDKKFLSDFKSMQVLGQMYREEEKKEVINNE